MKFSKELEETVWDSSHLCLDVCSVEVTIPSGCPDIQFQSKERIGHM